MAAGRPCRDCSLEWGWGCNCYSYSVWYKYHLDAVTHMNGLLQTVKMFGEEKDYAEIAKEIESVPGVVRCTFFPKCPLPSSHLEVEHDGTARMSAHCLVINDFHESGGDLANLMAQRKDRLCCGVPPKLL